MQDVKIKLKTCLFETREPINRTKKNTSIRMYFNVN